MKLINLHHPNERVWEDYAAERFGKTFKDGVVSRSLTHSDSIAPVEWVRSVLNEGDDEIVVFVSHPDKCMWPLLLDILDKSNLAYKVYGFVSDIHSNRHRPWRALLDNAMVASFDGLFVGSAWHRYKLVHANGWPEDKIHFVGYPVDITIPLAETEKENLVIVPHWNKDIKINFVLDVIETIGILWPDLESKPESLEFALHTYDIQDTDEYMMFQRLTARRMERLKKDLPKHVKISFWNDTGERKEVGSRARVVLSAKTPDSFDPEVANLIMQNVHPVVPDQTCYLEMMRINRTKDRYIYAHGDVEACARAVLKGVAVPAPPRSYIEDYGSAFDQMAKIMLGMTDD